MSNNKKPQTARDEDIVLADKAVDILKNAPGGQTFPSLYKQLEITKGMDRVYFRLALTGGRKPKAKITGVGVNAIVYVGELPSTPLFADNPMQQAAGNVASSSAIVLSEVHALKKRNAEILVRHAIAPIILRRYSEGFDTSAEDLKALTQTLAEWEQAIIALQNAGFQRRGYRSPLWTVGPNHPAFQETSND